MLKDEIHFKSARTNRAKPVFIWTWFPSALNRKYCLSLANQWLAKCLNQQDHVGDQNITSVLEDTFLSSLNRLILSIIYANVVWCVAWNLFRSIHSFLLIRNRFIRKPRTSKAKASKKYKKLSGLKSMGLRNFSFVNLNGSCSRPFIPFPIDEKFMTFPARNQSCIQNRFNSNMRRIILPFHNFHGSSWHALEGDFSRHLGAIQKLRHSPRGRGAGQKGD